MFAATATCLMMFVSRLESMNIEESEDADDQAVDDLMNMNITLSAQELKVR